MKTYQVKLKIKSFFLTPFQSDTIAGELYWAWIRKFGEEDFNASVVTEKTPLIVSDLFPEGFFPFPVNLDDFDPEESRGKDREKEQLQKRLKKKLKKFPYFSLETLKERGWSYNYKKLYEEILDLKICPFGGIEREKINCHYNGCLKLEGKECSKRKFLPPLIKERIRQGVSINRFSGKVTEGQLFNVKEYYPENWNADFNFFIKTDVEKGKLELILDYFFKKGHGAGTSRGYGEIKMSGFQEYKFGNETLVAEGKTTHFISLSHFIPASDDPTSGVYNYKIKFPKLGEEMAFQNETGEVIPWKKKMLFLTPGSVFRLPAERKPYYGKLLRNVHLDSRIVHHAYAFPLEIRVGGAQ